MQVTTGTPIMLVIDNEDQRSKDYDAIRDTYRPGHADYTYEAKYGIRDHRGGGRSSARETAARVAAGCDRTQARSPHVTIRGALVQMGVQAIDRARWDWDEVGQNPFFCPDAEAAKGFETYLDSIRKSGRPSARCSRSSRQRAGRLGAPIYGKLDADLAAALDVDHAVKGVEIGDRLRRRGAHRRGQCRRDGARPRRFERGAPAFLGQSCWRDRRRHFQRPADRRALRSEAHLLDPDAAQVDHPRRRAPRSSPKAATTPASASAPCRSARRWSPACWRTIFCASRQVG